MEQKEKNFSGSLSVDEFIRQFAFLTEPQIETLKKLRTEGKLY